MQIECIYGNILLSYILHIIWKFYTYYRHAEARNKKLGWILIKEKLLSWVSHFSSAKLELPLLVFIISLMVIKCLSFVFQNIYWHLLCCIKKARNYSAHCPINRTETFHQLGWWLYWCALGRIRTILSVKGWKTKPWTVKARTFQEC